MQMEIQQIKDNNGNKGNKEKEGDNNQNEDDDDENEDNDMDYKGEEYQPEKIHQNLIVIWI